MSLNNDESNEKITVDKDIFIISSKSFRRIFSQGVYVIPFLIVLGIIFAIINPRFYSFLNFTFLLKQSSILLIASLAETFVILIGSIDLSIQGIVVLNCVVSAILVNYFSSNPLMIPIVIFVSIVLGAVCGFLNGFILVKAKLPSFLITLGTGTIFNGIVLLITKGYTIPIFIASYKWLGKGNILKIPVLSILAIIIYISTIILLNYTPFGRYVFAVGGGELAARYSGVSTDKIKVLVFTFAGVLSGIAGALLSARLGSGSSTAGGTIELDVIAATVMAGTSLAGGVGNVSKTILGVIAISMLSNGLNIIGVSPHVQIVIKGIIIILVVMFSLDRSQISIAK